MKFKAKTLRSTDDNASGQRFGGGKHQRDFYFSSFYPVLLVNLSVSNAGHRAFNGGEQTLRVS